MIVGQDESGGKSVIMANIDGKVLSMTKRRLVMQRVILKRKVDAVERRSSGQAEETEQ
jgi:hypothetical protein